MKKYELGLRLTILVLIVLSALVVSNQRIRIGNFTLLGKHPVKYGLDIKGGIRAVLQAHPERAPGVAYDEPTVLRILTNRINNLGVGEATVLPKGDTQFIVELPDVKNKDAVLQQLGTTASMTFYYFQDIQSQRNQSAPLQDMPNRDASGHERTAFMVMRPWQGFNVGETFRDGSQIKADWTKLLDSARNNAAGPGMILYAPPPPDPTQASVLKSQGGADQLIADTPVYFNAVQQKQAAALNHEITGWNTLISDSLLANNGSPILTGADIEPSSSARLSGASGAEPAVSQSFKPKGAQKYADFTTAHVGEVVGIVLDDTVIEAPFIKEPILDGEGEISGGFSSLTEAKNLADLLNAGALPVPLEQVQTESVEASLGQGAVSASVKAGLLGLALVLVFMLAYYRLPGLVADVALLIYALFTLAIYRGGLNWLFPGLVVTLTLPGIAGFILSIGMAVDANILIFERLKEELRSGKSLRPAIDAGFKRAFTAIRDSNICTCITCIVLLSLGTASVRGFALTLLIGVLVSLFSAITVTRTLLYLLVDTGFGKNLALFGVHPETSAFARAEHPTPNIIGRRKFFYGLSLAIIVPGIIFWALGGLHYGIDFKGGTQIQVHYPQPVTQGAVKSALAAAGYHDSTVQMAEGGSNAIVSVLDHSSEGNPALNPVHQGLMIALNTLGPASEESFGNVGSIVSTELKSRALEAVAVASLLIVLYLAAVFAIGGFVAGLRLGTSAIVALVHDVLVLIGSFAILGYFLGWQVDSLFVTALLTVIGFSVHDTVVIFDRVRENLRHKARGENFESLVNRSIGQTLTRSINTSLTVLMTLAALIILGGQTTRLLNVALFIGILSGTYSSIFNAASILVDWENWLARRRGAVSAEVPVLDGAAAPAAAVLPSGGAKIYPASGGSTRPVSASANGDGFSRPTEDVEISRIRKKKKPARRILSN